MDGPKANMNDGFLYMNKKRMENGTPVNPVNYYFSDLTPEQYNKLIEQSRQPSQSFD